MSGDTSSTHLVGLPIHLQAANCHRRHRLDRVVGLDEPVRPLQVPALTATLRIRILLMEEGGIQQALEGLSPQPIAVHCSNLGFTWPGRQRASLPVIHCPESSKTIGAWAV